MDSVGGLIDPLDLEPGRYAVALEVDLEKTCKMPA